MNPGSVFISHSSKHPDFPFTEALAQKFDGAGLDVWWDKNKLEGGDNFTAEIVEAIIHQYYFVLVLSGNSAGSSWCRRELARAVELGKTIIPLKLEEVPNEKLPLELAGLNYVDGRQGVDACFPALARAIGLGLKDDYDPTTDPFARDGRLIQAISEQLRYGKTFTDAPNLVRLVSSIGLRCCETQRARDLLAAMLQPAHYTGSKIDYDKVSEYLTREWHG